jgi:hypothetical protein
MFERIGKLREHAGYLFPRSSGILDAGTATGLVVVLSGLAEDGTIPIIHDPAQIGATVFSIVGLTWLALNNNEERSHDI